jgi:hypothetical protein
MRRSVGPNENAIADEARFRVAPVRAWNCFARRYRDEARAVRGEQRVELAAVERRERNDVRP